MSWIGTGWIRESEVSLTIDGGVVSGARVVGCVGFGIGCGVGCGWFVIS